MAEYAGKLTQINGYLFLSDYPAVCDFDQLKSAGISHIINAAGECENVFEGKVEYFTVDARDNLAQRLAPYFNSTRKFINEARLNGGKVAVHCREGISRSATLTIAFLMSEESRNLADVVGEVKKKRYIVEPNASFMKELRNLEKQLGLLESVERLTAFETFPLKDAQDSAEGTLELWTSRAATETNFEHSKAARDFTKKLSSVNIELKLHNMICTTFEDYATLSLRDNRARAVLPLALKACINGTLTTKEGMREILSNIQDSDAWDGMDVPYAKRFLQELEDEFGDRCEENQAK